MKDHYQVLDVPRTATAEEIRRAYLTASRKHHPDRHPPDKRANQEVIFKEIVAANEILSDPAKKRDYDSVMGGRPSGMTGMPGRPFAATNGWTSFRYGSASDWWQGMPSRHHYPYSSFFEFEQKNARPAPAPPPPPPSRPHVLAVPHIVTVEIKTTLESLFASKTKELRVTRRVRIDPITKQTVVDSKNITVKFTPSNYDGDVVDIKDAGDAIFDPDLTRTIGFNPLRLKLRVESKNFTRKGRTYDLETTVRTTDKDVERGSSITVDGIDGAVIEIALDDRIKDGFTLIRRGHGMPIPTGGRGNLMVKFEVKETQPYVVQSDGESEAATGKRKTTSTSTAGIPVRKKRRRQDDIGGDETKAEPVKEEERPKVNVARPEPVHAEAKWSSRMRDDVEASASRPKRNVKRPPNYFRHEYLSNRRDDDLSASNAAAKPKARKPSREPSEDSMPKAKRAEANPSEREESPQLILSGDEDELDVTLNQLKEERRQSSSTSSAAGKQDQRAPMSTLFENPLRRPNGATRPVPEDPLKRVNGAAAGRGSGPASQKPPQEPLGGYFARRVKVQPLARPLSPDLSVPSKRDKSEPVDSGDEDTAAFSDVTPLRPTFGGNEPAQRQTRSSSRQLPTAWKDGGQKAGKTVPDRKRKAPPEPEPEGRYDRRRPAAPTGRAQPIPTRSSMSDDEVIIVLDTDSEDERRDAPAAPADAVAESDSSEAESNTGVNENAVSPEYGSEWGEVPPTPPRKMRKMMFGAKAAGEGTEMDPIVIDD
ncbi:hypothetical protein HK101_010004 [Irineochytrium annulatum]|nr:hypothetical protein HK101_010004 [Irineochytrium annulatum]